MFGKLFGGKATPAAAGAQAGGGSRALVPAARPMVVARADFAEFLPDVQAVTEQRHSPLARLLIGLIAGFVVLALVWAHFAEVEQVASATGVVRPVGQSKTINHPEGGRVAELLVAEGAAVEAGQPLIRLDPEIWRVTEAQQTREWQTLAAEVARLEAEANGLQTIDFPAELAAQRPDLLTNQSRVLEARLNALETRRDAARQIVEQRGSEAAALAETRTRLANSLALLKEQEVAVAKLVEKGYYPRLKHLTLKREISDQVGEIAELEEQLHAAQSALEEARSQHLRVDRDARAEVLDELEIRRRERDVAASSLQQAKAQLRNLEIRSPVAGVVQNLQVTSSGQSIRPSEPIMTVVPKGDSLVVEAQVSNDDIGHISVGQRATVKVRTYDFVKFGTLDGTVEQVAADATKDEETGEFTFKVRVRTARGHLGEDGARLPVQAGMVVVVDLHIGERSILSYLTDRVLRTTQSAFRER